MSEKKNPPMPPRSEEEVVFGDELPVLPIRNAVLFPAPSRPSTSAARSRSRWWRTSTTSPARSSRSSPSAIRRPTIPGRRTCTRSGCAARVLKALEAQLGQLLADLAGPHAHPARQRHGPHAVPARQDPPHGRAGDGGRRGGGAGDEPARHREAGHPADARAARARRARSSTPSRRPARSPISSRPTSTRRSRRRRSSSRRSTLKERIRKVLRLLTRSSRS